MDITKFAIKNRVTVLVVCVLLLFTGMKTYQGMQKGEDPPFTIKIATITTVWPGATAGEMSEFVGNKVEEMAKDMEELDFVETKNFQGVSTTYINIKPQYRNLLPIWDKLRKKIKYEIEPNLPQGAMIPVLNDEFGDVYGSVLMVSGEGFSHRELQKISEEIKTKILTEVPEAGKVHIFGDQAERIYVEFEQNKLASLGINPSNIMSAISTQNKISPSGMITTSDYNMMIQSTGNFKSIKDLENTTISNNGNLIYLKDIAHIRRGYVDPQSYKAKYNGTDSLAIGVTLKTGQDDTQLGEHLKEVKSKLEDLYPIGVNFDFVAFSPERVNIKIDSFLSNLIQAVITVLIVMLISLGMRTGLVVASLIPLSISMAIIAMPFFGVNLDQMSLAGLIIALGMLVDNAIVMSESILISMESGVNRLEACLKSANQLKIPLLMSSLTTIAAFVPIFLISESMGEYVGPMAKVVVLTLISSWIVAMTVVPLLCYLFLKVEHKKTSYEGKVYKSYRKILLFGLKNKLVTVGFAICLFLLGVFLFRFLGNEFIPASDRTIMITTVRMPKGTSFEKTNEVMNEYDKFLGDNYKVEDKQVSPGIVTNLLSGFTIKKYEKDGVLNWGTFVGGPAPRFVLTYNPEAPTTEYASVIANMTNTEIINGIAETIDNHMKTLYPDIDITTKKLPMGMSSEKDVEYRISSNNLENLFDKAEIVERKLKSLPMTKDIGTTWKNKVKTLNFDIDEDKIASLGISRDTVVGTLYGSLQGQMVGGLREIKSPLVIKTIPIILRDKGAYKTKLDRIETLQVFSPTTNQFVPLSQLVKTRINFDYGYIYKRDGVYTIGVQANVIDGYIPNQVDVIMSPWVAEQVKTWESELGDNDVKTTALAGLVSQAQGSHYKYSIGGATEESNKQSAALGEKLPYAGLFILLLLVAQFNSIKKPIIILLTIPLGILGVAVGLIVGHQNFGFFAIIGLVSLSGVVINNAIVLIDQIDLEIHEHNRDPRDAIVVSALSRFRPILLTTITTLCGLIPLWLFGGNMWKPLAVSLIFGLMFATILTLGVIPVLYSIFFKIKYKKYVYDKDVIEEKII